METEKKKELEMPSKTLKVRIGVNDYEIKMPTNGQRIDIESAKVRMTGGSHKDLILGGESAIEAWIISEAIATFNVLIPKLSTDLVVNLLDLDALQSKSLVKAFEKFHAWDKSWREFINQDINEDEKK